MSKNKKIAIIVVFAGIILALMIGSYFIIPIAPLIIGLFFLVQSPFFIRLFKAGFGDSYRQRSDKRRADFLEGQINAGQWFVDEEKESQAKGFEHWSAAGKSLNALNRAEALAALGKKDEARAVFLGIKAENLSEIDLPRYNELMSRDKNTEEEPVPIESSAE